MKRDSSKPKPGGFANLSRGMLCVWPYLPAHHMRLIPLIESFQPNSWPAQGTLARLLRIGRQSVNRTVSQLKASGLYVVDHRTKTKGGNDSCHYRTADLADDDTQRQVIAWYVANFPDTPGARADRAALSHPECDSAPCRILDATAPVARKDATALVAPTGVQPLSHPECDTNRQRNEQSNPQPLRGAPPGLDLVCDSLRGEVLASPAGAEFARWLAFKRDKGAPLDQQQQRALFSELSKFNAQQLTGPVSQAIAGNFRTIYTDRIKSNGRNKSHEWAEPDYSALIPRHGTGAVSDEAEGG